MKTQKVFAILLTVAMGVATFVGCGNSTATDLSSTEQESDISSSVEEAEEREVYEATLMYYAATDSAPGFSEVEEKLNELTMEALNTHVNLLPVTLGTYQQQVQLMLSGGEELDILPVVDTLASSFVDAGYLVNLTDYLDEYAPDALSIIGRDNIKCCSVGDFLYGFPTMMERTHSSGIVMRNDILQEIGVNAENIETFDDLTEVFAKVKEQYPDMVVFGGAASENIPTLSNHIDKLMDSFGVLDNYGEETTIVNLYETETYKNMVYQMRDWYLDGYISKDYPTSTDTGDALMRAGNLFAYATNTKPDTKKEKDAITGYDTAVFIFNEPLLTTAGTAMISYGIANNSENPARAIELYNWIVATKEANDLLNWGIEGKDWIEAEDGTAAYPDGVTDESVSYHQNFGFGMPNQMNAHVWIGNDPTIYEQYQNLTDSAHVSKAYGFTFDGTTVANEIAALTSVQQQYANTIGSGSVDPDSALQEFNDALYNAGLQTVIDEKQRQFDEWLSNQN